MRGSNTRLAPPPRSTGLDTELTCSTLLPDCHEEWSRYRRTEAATHRAIKKRDTMSGSSSKKRRRTEEPKVRARRSGVPISSGTSPEDASFNRMFRKTCSECGSTELEWASLATLAQEGSDDEKAFATGMAEMVGSDASGNPAGEAWHCTSCGERGAFGSMQSGF